MATRSSSLILKHLQRRILYLGEGFSVSFDVSINLCFKYFWVFVFDTDWVEEV